MLGFLKRLAATRKARQQQIIGNTQLQTFILEPILTPSAVLDIGEDAPDPDSIDLTADILETIEFPDEAELPSEPNFSEAESETIAFVTALNETAEIANDRPAFESGVFTVNNSGQVSIDFLFDGGGYRGELAIFSLEGLDGFNFNNADDSREFIQVARDRALSNSEWGHIIISDRNQGARFNGLLGEAANWNQGRYQGVQTFELNPGDRYGFMLVPHGKIEQLLAPETPLKSYQQPLFSMATADPNDLLTGLQMVDLTSDGHTFSFEDLALDDKSDRDYNDLIFQMKGATGKVTPIAELIDPSSDWLESDLGQEILHYDTNIAPAKLQLGSEAFYTANEPIQVLGKVYDIDGASDLTTIDFHLRQDGGEWQAIANTDRLTTDEQGWATFEYQLTDLEPGHYQLQAIAYDQHGATSSSTHQDFVILSTPEELPNSVKIAIEQSIDLDRYNPEALAETTQWVASIQTGQSPDTLAAQAGAVNLSSTNRLPNTYVWEFAPDIAPETAAGNMAALSGVEYGYPLVELQWTKQLLPNDRFFNNQWHLYNTGQSGSTAGIDANLTAAWELAQGTGVVIGIVDDGIEYTHPDLYNNYRADLSRNFNQQTVLGTYDNVPLPAIDSGDFHGTAVAGVAAATSNNDIGISGVAPEAEIAGLRLLGRAEGDLSATGLSLAAALYYLPNDIDIYNNSWKLTWFVDRPEYQNYRWRIPAPHYKWRTPAPPSAVFTFDETTTQGRDGLGSIQVWAGGNDRSAGGNVNYNALANSRYTIAVATLNHNGTQTFYSEPGAPLLISAYSSGAGASITTTDIVGEEGYHSTEYTHTFGGASAAAATVSGVVALMLEANPALTWRDVQHILIDSARKNDPGNEDWQQNGTGRWVNHRYGFGAVDAAKAVELATNWQLVNAELELDYGVRSVGRTVLDGDLNGLTGSVTVEENITVEWVEIALNIVDVNFRGEGVRGDLSLVLTSPDGTRSVLAEPHIDRNSGHGKWLFTTARHWGESSQGDWKLTVADGNGNEREFFWDEWQLVLYGTEPIVNIENIDPDASESANEDDPGAFIVRRTGNTSAPLTVEFETEFWNHWQEGNAYRGSDYDLVANDEVIPTDSSRITIPAGASSVTVFVQPRDDSEPELLERARLRLAAGNGYEVGPTDLAEVEVWDNETPQVWVFSEPYAGAPSDYRFNYASESRNRGSFGFRRMGNLRQELTVQYEVTGTASLGEDYTLGNAQKIDIDGQERTIGSVTFPAVPLDRSVGSRGPISSNTSIPEGLVPVDDDLIEGEETVILSLVPSNRYSILDDRNSIPTTIWDNDDKPTVTLRATDPTASENGDPGQLTVTRTGSTAENLKVRYFFEPTEHWPATPGEDYPEIGSEPIEPDSSILINGRSITIPAGKSSATIDIKPIDDRLVEDDEAISLFLSRSDDYAIGDYYWGEVTILDNEKPEQEWQQPIETNAYDAAFSLAVDRNDRVYVAGRTAGDLARTNAGIGDPFIARYNRQGQAQPGNQPGTSGFDEARGIAVDGAGNTYVAIWSDDTSSVSDSVSEPGSASTSEQGVWLVSYDANGNLNWQEPLNNPSYTFSNGSLTADASGNLYLVGYTYRGLESANQVSADAWIAKYDSQGNQQWVQQLGSTAQDEARSVAVDAAGNVYVTGYAWSKLQVPPEVAFTGDYEGDADIWAAKYNASGQLKWAQQFGTVAWEDVRDIAVNDQGQIYLVGQTKGWLGETYQGDVDNWVGDYDAWWAAHAHRDSSGLGGTYHGNGDAWVAQLDSATGDLSWKRLLGTAAAEAANGVATDAAGGVYLTGFTGGLLGDAQFGGDDVFVAKYDDAGALQWKQQLGSAGDEVANDIAFSGSGLYLAGNTSGDFAGSRSSSEDSGDAWVMKLS